MTIYALSSGPGISGVAVVRVSGKDTAKVVKKLLILILRLFKFLLMFLFLCFPNLIFTILPFSSKVLIQPNLVLNDKEFTTYYTKSL